MLGDEGPNTFTSTADTIAVGAGTVTAGAGLDRLDISALGGSDSVNLAAFTALPTHARVSLGTPSEMKKALAVFRSTLA